MSAGRIFLRVFGIVIIPLFFFSSKLHAQNIAVAGTVSAATFSGTLNAGTLSSITSVGTLTGLTVTGPVIINDNNNSNVNINTGTSTGTITMGGSAAITLNIGNGVGGNTLNLGNGINTSAQTINIGSGASAANNTIHIGDGTNTVGATSVILGSVTNLANTTLIQGGNGLDAITLAPHTAGGIVIGATAGTGAITVGESSATQIVNIGTGTGAATVNIATGATNAKNINIGTGAIANNILIGNTTAGTTTGINVTSATAQLHLGAGTATANEGAPLKFTSSANLLTTAEAGAVEYDGTVFFGSIANATRSVLAAQQVIVLSSANTLTNQTAAQPLFDGGGGPASGSVALPVGTYLFECFYSLSGMATSSGSFGFSLVTGSGTFTYAYTSMAVKAAPGTASNLQTVSGTAAITSLTGANTTATGTALIKGVIRVTAAATIVPSVSLTTAAAASVGANSRFIVYPISNSGTGTFVGKWN